MYCFRFNRRYLSLYRFTEPPAGIAGEGPNQPLPDAVVLWPYHAQANQPNSHGKPGVVGVYGLGGHPFLLLGRLAKASDELRVIVGRVLVEWPGEPGELEGCRR